MELAAAERSTAKLAGEAADTNVKAWEHAVRCTEQACTMVANYPQFFNAVDRAQRPLSDLLSLEELGVALSKAQEGKTEAWSSVKTLDALVAGYIESYGASYEILLGAFAEQEQHASSVAPSQQKCNALIALSDAIVATCDECMPPARYFAGERIRLKARCISWLQSFAEREGVISRVKSNGTFDIKFDDHTFQRSVKESQIAQRLDSSDHILKKNSRWHASQQFPISTGIQTYLKALEFRVSEHRERAEKLRNDAEKSLVAVVAADAARTNLPESAELVTTASGRWQDAAHNAAAALKRASDEPLNPELAIEAATSGKEAKAAAQHFGSATKAYQDACVE